MSGPSERDLRLGRVSWTRRVAEQERSARSAEGLHAEGLDPPGTAQMASADWSVVAGMRVVAGDLDGAAEVWPQAVDWARRSHDLYGREATGERSADSAEWPLGLALVGDDRDAVAQLAAPYDPRSPLGRPWARVLVALARADDDAVRSAGADYEREVPAVTAAKQRRLPGLGAAATAVVDGDEAALREHLGVALAAQERFVRRGHRKGSSSALLDPQLLVLARGAAARGVPVAVDDRYRAVPVRFTVASEFDFEGRPARGETFLWPLDLLPTAFLDRLAG